jgi:hypothetical protein
VSDGPVTQEEIDRVASAAGLPDGNPLRALAVLGAVLCITGKALGLPREAMLISLDKAWAHMTDEARRLGME